MRDLGDLKQKLRTVATLSAEGVRVLLGCFLMLFVSQSCGSDTCTSSDIMNTSNAGRDVFWVLHFLSAILILMSYTLEARREKWLINSFDSDPAKPDQAMQEAWVKYPERHQDFRHRTRVLRISVGISGIVYLANWLGTSVFLIGWHWNGVSTLTGLITQGVLVVQSLASTYRAATASLERDVPVSTVLTEPTVFNKWDDDIKEMETIENANAETATAEVVQVDV